MAPAAENAGQSKFDLQDAASFVAFSALAAEYAGNIHDAALSWRNRGLEKPIWIGGLRLQEQVINNLKSILAEVNEAMVRVDAAKKIGTDYAPQEPPPGFRTGPSGGKKRARKSR